MTYNCPLCQSVKISFFCKNVKGKSTFKYYRCNNCDLVFMQRDRLLTPEDESSRYLMHQNDKRTLGYEMFLRELIDPMLRRVKLEAEGLDYGSGPYPMLAKIIEENGYNVEVYDPFFANHQAKLMKQYDFITCCEVAEHFHHPNKEFSRLKKMLKPNGLLGIRTNILYSHINFSNWYYKDDDTHVVFYSPKTVNWICESFAFKLEFLGQNVFILKNMI